MKVINRQLPFNQLGIDVSGAASSEEVLDMAGLNFSVESRPIFDSLGNEIPGFRANTREDDNSILGIVGNRYNIVQNKDAFAFTDNIIGDGVSYEKAGIWKRGAAMWILAKMPEKKILDDACDPYMIFINSHDGLGSVRVSMLPIRIACSNAINFALKSAKRNWSAVHAGNINSRLKEAERALGLAEDYMEALDVEANILAEKKFSDAQFEAIIDKIFPVDPDKDSERKMRNIAEIKSGLFNCLQAPDLSNYKGTAYAAIQATADFVDHADPNRSTDTFEDARWQRIALGHSTVDNFYKEIVAA